VARAQSSSLTLPEFQILLALTDGERHGYDIMLAIARDSDGAARLGPTTLYRSIRGLLQARLIEESDQRPDPAVDDQRRRYYELTESGLEAARLEADRLRRLLAIADRKTLTRHPQQGTT
jgi:DNA-binding PadR family transcriptional regulator